MSRPAAPLVVSRDQRAELEAMSRSGVLAHRVVCQARALLLASEGAANEEIARRCGVGAAAPEDGSARWPTRAMAARHG